MSWAEDAHRRLAAAGHKSGGARDAVIDALARSGGCRSAQELADQLRAEGRAVGLASIYRALTALSELRLIRGSDVGEGVARYELVLESGEHHHHVVCDRCGKTEAFTDDALERAIHRAADATRYDVAHHDVVLHGVCPDCQA